MKRFNTVLLVLGLAFLLYLIEKTGWRELWLQLRVLGWGITLILLAEGLANLAHTVGWRHCIPSSSNSSLWRLFRMNMAGWAINYLTPTASVGGEVTRASLLADRCDGTEAVSSVFLDKLMTAIAHLALVLLGMALLLWQVKLPLQLWMAMAITLAVLAAGIAGFFLLQTRGTIGTACQWLLKRKIGSRFVQPAVGNLSRVDAVLKRFYRERPRDLLLSILWHALGHSVALIHTWLFLTFLGQPAPVITVVTVACLALWFDLLTFAVPINLGTLEASRILILKIFGCQALLGMAFGMAIRAAQLFWASFGLASYASFNFFQKAERTWQTEDRRSKKAEPGLPSPTSNITICHLPSSMSVAARDLPRSRPENTMTQDLSI
jgi:glycosyltransferase 2 family protein